MRAELISVSPVNFFLRGVLASAMQAAPKASSRKVSGGYEHVVCGFRAAAHL